MTFRTIAARVILYTATAVVVVLGVGSFLLVRFEAATVDDYDHEYRSKIRGAIEARAAEQFTVLHRNVRLNTDVLARSISVFLYNLNEEELRKALPPFLNYHEVLAVKVLDDLNAPFAAVWRAGDKAVTGKTLPEGQPPAGAYTVKMESRRGEQQVGTVEVYYSDQALHDRIEAAKQRAEANAETFYQAGQVRLQNALLSQLTGIGVVLLLLVGLLGWILHRLVRRPLLKLSRVAMQLAELDLSISVNHRHNQRKHDEVDTLFAALDLMTASFRNVVGQVQISGIQVSSATSELSASSKQHEAVLASQLDATHHVSEAVAEISHAAEHLATAMREVADTSQQAGLAANQGRDELHQMQDALRHMEAASQRVSERLHTIDEKTTGISQVITTITKVADQTNLLSLNAAIEAEKAGKYGRGFTVVAREIRRLADQTAVAALDIDGLINEMQTGVRAGVEEIGNFTDEVRRNVQNVSSVSTRMADIITQMQTLLPRFEDINTAVGQQSENAGSISQAMHDLEMQMQETTASLRESFLSLDQLSEATRHLHQQLARFKVE